MSDELAPTLIDMNQMTDMHSQTYRAIDMLVGELLDFMQAKDYNSALSALAAMGDVIRMTHLITNTSEKEHGA